MASAEEDDVQAEQQIQASLQRVAEDSVQSLPSEHSEEQTRSLSNAEGHIECGSAHVSLSKGHLSPRLAVCRSPKFRERTTCFQRADVFQPATGNQGSIKFGPLQEDDGDGFRGLCERNAHMSPSYPPGIENETCPKALSGPMGSRWETRQHSDQDVNMEGLGSSAPKMSRITTEAALAPAVALPNAFTGTASSTATNPWSTFASSTEFHSFTTHTLSSAFPFGDRLSSTATTSPEGAEKVDGFKPCPSLFSEDVAQGQGSGRLKLQRNGRDALAVDESLTDSSRELQNSSTDSFETTKEATFPPRERDLNVQDKQNSFFDGLQPSRMTLISGRKSPTPMKMLSGSQRKMTMMKWKPSASNIVQSSTPQDIVKVQKEKKSNERTHGSEAKSSSARECPKVETQSAVEGIESLKKRYAYLDPALASSKEWSFAWQEIAAILRTPFSYHHIPWQKGYAMQLKTDFKVFRFHGPFSRKEGKEVITKKAVLYVLDGPFFFRQAAPALQMFCRANGLAAPTYTHTRHPDGTFACSVRVGSESNVFVDNEEGWDDREDAREDTAKMAMNALYREGVPMDIEATTDAISVRTKSRRTESRSEPQRSKKRKAPMASLWEDGRRTCSRIKEDLGLEAQYSRAPRARTGNPLVNTVDFDTGDAVQEINIQSNFGSATSSPRTRAGLARLLKGVLQPQERVGAMCDYLMIQQPEYWMERHSSGEKWLASFFSEQPAEKTGHTLIAPTIVHSLNGLQDCASRVEQGLFEKIYSGEIHLEDGCATFPDRAVQDERIRPSGLRPGVKQLLEMDEGVALEKISQRYEGPANILLRSSANAMPLGVARRPPTQPCSWDQDTGYESEDDLPASAMILADTHDEATTGRSHFNILGAPHSQQSQRARQPPTTALQRFEAITNRNRAEQFNDPNEQPLLLPSGEHRYVSPPPFLDTPHLPCTKAPPPVKAEPQSEDHQDDEPVYVGERTIQQAW